MTNPTTEEIEEVLKFLEDDPLEFEAHGYSIFKVLAAAYRRSEQEITTLKAQVAHEEAIKSSLAAAQESSENFRRQLCKWQEMYYKLESECDSMAAENAEMREALTITLNQFLPELDYKKGWRAGMSEERMENLRTILCRPTSHWVEMVKWWREGAEKFEVFTDNKDWLARKPKSTGEK